MCDKIGGMKDITVPKHICLLVLVKLKISLSITLL